MILRSSMKAGIWNICLLYALIGCSSAPRFGYKELSSIPNKVWIDYSRAQERFAITQGFPESLRVDPIHLFYEATKEVERNSCVLIDKAMTSLACEDGYISEFYASWISKELDKYPKDILYCLSVVGSFTVFNIKDCGCTNPELSDEEIMSNTLKIVMAHTTAITRAKIIKYKPNFKKYPILRRFYNQL